MRSPSTTAAPRNPTIPASIAQYSTGFSARSTYTGLGSATLTTIATYADTKVNYGYDGDWGNPVLWAPYTDDYTEDQVRASLDSQSGISSGRYRRRRKRRTGSPGWSAFMPLSCASH